jgi:hypothetical protein
MRLAGLRDIEGQLEPDVAGSGAVDTNEDVVKAHSPSPDHSSQDTLERRPPESTRSTVIGKPGYTNILPPGLGIFRRFSNGWIIGCGCRTHFIARTFCSAGQR